jgi:hypothetical protein
MELSLCGGLGCDVPVALLDGNDGGELESGEYVMVAFNMGLVVDVVVVGLSSAFNLGEYELVFTVVLAEVVLVDVPFADVP